MEATRQANTDAKKPAGRLQSLAPPSLQLDCKTDATAATWEDVASPTPIPLLSPLSFAPAPWAEAEAEAEPTAGLKDGGGDVKAPEQAAGGWKHPALAFVAPEPTSLLPFFQSQCALAHSAHSTGSRAPSFLF